MRPGEQELRMTPVIDDADSGPPPAKRAVFGLLLGVAAGAVASVLLPAEPDQPPQAPETAQ